MRYSRLYRELVLEHKYTDDYLAIGLPITKDIIDTLKILLTDYHPPEHWVKTGHYYDSLKTIEDFCMILNIFDYLGLE